jgi:hypothetical protein
MGQRKILQRAEFVHLPALETGYSFLAALALKQATL